MQNMLVIGILFGTPKALSLTFFALFMIVLTFYLQIFIVLNKIIITSFADFLYVHSV